MTSKNHKVHHSLEDVKRNQVFLITTLLKQRKSQIFSF